MDNQSLASILKLSEDDSFVSHIDESQVDQAKYYIIQWIGEENDEDEIFKLLLSLNLLNAAVKMKRYKKIISYGLIKSRVSRLLNLLISSEKANKNIQFYINLDENCAYVEMRKLQFSFHQIALKGNLAEFAKNADNLVKPWREVRLQKIAGELFSLFHNPQDPKQVHQPY